MVSSRCIAGNETVWCIDRPAGDVTGLRDGSTLRCVTGWVCVCVWVYRGDVCERYGLVSIVNGLQVVGFVMFRNARREVSLHVTFQVESWFVNHQHGLLVQSFVIG